MGDLREYEPLGSGEWPSSTKDADYRDHGYGAATGEVPLTDQEVRDLARIIKNSIAVATTAIEKLQKDRSVTIDFGCDRTPAGNGYSDLHLSVIITRPEVL